MYGDKVEIRLWKPIIITEFPYTKEQEQCLIDLETTKEPQCTGFLNLIKSDRNFKP
jgi:hypothetical protein